MLFHVSAQSDITRFEPRVGANSDAPVVWAVDEARLGNYLLPRDCPRVTFYAGEHTTAADRERLLGSGDAVVAFESGWLERVRRARLYCYRLPEASFVCVDRCAGYFHSSSTVIPAGMDVVDDCLSMLVRRGIEVRILQSLWALHDQVIASSVNYSIIRMRNAIPRCSV